MSKWLASRRNEATTYRRNDERGVVKIKFFNDGRIHHWIEDKAGNVLGQINHLSESQAETEMAKADIA